MGRVVVGRSTLGAQHSRKRLVGHETRSFGREFVNRLAEGVGKIQQESVSEAMFDLRYERVEVCLRVWSETENVVDLGALLWIEEFQILELKA